MVRLTTETTPFVTLVEAIPAVAAPPVPPPPVSVTVGTGVAAVLAPDMMMATEVKPPLGRHPVVYPVGVDISFAPVRQVSAHVELSPLTATGVILFPLSSIRTHFKSNGLVIFQGAELDRLSSTTEYQVVPEAIVVQGTPTVHVRLKICC